MALYPNAPRPSSPVCMYAAASRPLRTPIRTAWRLTRSNCPHAHSGFLDAASKLYAQGGFRAFYRGYTPCLARSMPANAACFYAYETTRQMLE